MRVFVALVLPEPLRRALIESTADLCAARSELRWIASTRLHLTVSFLGELDERGIDIAVEAAEQAAAFQPFTLGATGLLAMPRRSSCRVLSAAIGPGGRETSDIADRFERALAEIGRETAYPFRPPERRPFTPHITLARSGRAPVAFNEDELALRLEAAAGITALGVYESVLGSREAHYRELARVELGFQPVGY